MTKGEIKPHKNGYYMERRDPRFENKMMHFIHVYKDLELIDQLPHDVRESRTLPYDEKPGIQAIKNISAQLKPVPDVYSSFAEDDEYKRFLFWEELTFIPGRYMPWFGIDIAVENS